MTNQQNDGFNIGDVVQLRSGSPLMTVISINQEKAVCQWFERNTAKSGEFVLESLVISVRGPRSISVV